MRTLFEIDSKDYDTSWNRFVRPSVRGIIIRNGRVAMVESKKHHYWKFPGGGIEKGESLMETLIREVREEAGLTVIPETIREYGNVPRREKSDKFPETVFEQDNYYFLCDAEDEVKPQILDDYEDEESFTLSFIDPRIAIHDNLELDHGPKEWNMIFREAKVLELLISEGFMASSGK